MIDLDFDKIPLDDKKTYDLLCEGKTLGVFQLESPLLRHWTKVLQPHSIEDISALIAIVRPGVLKSKIGNKSLAQMFCDRKNGKEEVIYYHPSLEDILQNTYGINVFQESSLKIVQKLAGFDLKQADGLRAALGKKLADKMAEVKKEYMLGCEKVGIVNQKEAEDIFNWIEQGQRYQFNCAHSVSYALNSYFTAYCKANHPVEFLCASLFYSKDKQDSIQEVRELVMDARSMNIDVLTPDLRKRQGHFHIDGTSVRFGLSDIKGVGSSAVDKLLKKLEDIENAVAIKLEEWSWFQFLILLSDKINSTALKALIGSGALDFFGVNRQKMLLETSKYSELTEKEKDALTLIYVEYDDCNSLEFALEKGQGTKKNGGIAHNEKRATVIQDILKILKSPPVSTDDDLHSVVTTEERLLGISLSRSRLDRPVVNANCTVVEFPEWRGNNIIISCELDSCREVKIKNGANAGQPMAFLTISDPTGSMDSVVCFSEAYAEYKHLLVDRNTVLLDGYRDKKKGGFVVNKVFQI